MQRDEQLSIINKLDKQALDLLFSKGADYATQDVLSNFKRISGAAKILNMDVRTPYGYAMFMVLMKLDRINNLITSSKTPNNESIDDSYVDLCNYARLAYCCLKDIEIPMDENIRYAGSI